MDEKLAECGAVEIIAKCTRGIKLDLSSPLDLIRCGDLIVQFGLCTLRGGFKKDQVRLFNSSIDRGDSVCGNVFFKEKTLCITCRDERSRLAARWLGPAR